MSVARGILSGFLKEGLEQKAARDEMYADLVKEAGQEFRKTAQLFRKEEEDIEKRFKIIEADLGTNAALYASYNGLTTSDSGTNLVLKKLNNPENAALKKQIAEFDFQGYGFNTAKTSRAMDFKKQQKDSIDLITKNQGSGPVAELMFKDLKSMDTGTEVARPELDLPKMSEFGGSSTYDIKNYGTERREFDTDFRTNFRNPVSGAPEINVGPSDPRYKDQEFLKEGYDEAIKNGYRGSQFQYMLNKYIDNEFKKQGITGYPTGFPKTEEAKTTEATTQDAETFPGSKKLFEAPDTSQIGAKEDTNINLKSKRPIEGGGFGSAATVINDLRDIIARISDSPSLSDDDKNSRIDTARARAKERIEAMGLDSDNFNL